MWQILGSNPGGLAPEMKGADQLLSEWLLWRMEGWGGPPARRNGRWPAEQGSEAAHNTGAGPSGVGNLRAPSRRGRGVGEKLLNWELGKGSSWPVIVIGCLVLRT